MHGRAIGLAALIGLGAAGCTTLDPSESGHLVPRTVAEDPTLPAIEMNGSRFHLETFGNPSGPVIVFLHGGPGADYRGMLALGQRWGGFSLADEYYLVFWDQRGAGLSMRHGKEVLTLAQYDADLDSLVNRFSPGRPVILIGQSWGGMYATAYINRHPARVAAAVLIEPGPLTGATYERIEKDLFDLSLGSEWLNDLAWNSQFFTPEDHARMDYQLLLGMKNSQPRFHQRMEAPEPIWRIGAAAGRYLKEDGRNAEGIQVYDFTADLSRYTTPVLFIAGGLSEVLGEPLQREQVKLYPSASLVVIDQAGHDVHWSHAAQVLPHIRAYLDARKGAL